MAKLRKRLVALAHSLGIQKPLLARARRRYKSFHRRAFQAMKQKEAARAAADKLRAEAGVCFTYGPNEDAAKGMQLLRKAERKDAKALRFEAAETKNRAKKVFWRGRVRTLHKLVQGIETDIAGVEDELAKLKAKHGVTIEGNKASGGTPFQRWKAVLLAAAANCASNHRRNFYSQSGSWDCKHEIEPGPSYAERSDCSEFVTGAAYSAGLKDPNGARFTGGYTGTLLGQHNGWREVSEAEMKRAGKPALIVYVSSWSDTEGHHTDGWCPSPGDADRTIGHGSAPVDAGTVDDFGDGLFRCLIYDPK